MEKDMTGLYVTGHPLSSYRQAIDSMPDHEPGDQA